MNNKLDLKQLIAEALDPIVFTTDCPTAEPTKKRILEQADNVLDVVNNEILVLRDALKSLVDTKTHKELYGKDKTYKDKRDIAWEKAYKALNQSVKISIDPWTHNNEVPKDNYMYRVSFGYGQEDIIKWCNKKKAWVNFENDRIYIEYKDQDEPLKYAEAWQPYNYRK